MSGGPGLGRGVEGEPAEFNVWTREAGPGSLAISVEGPSKAHIDFKDRKDGSCYVSYIVEVIHIYSYMGPVPYGTVTPKDLFHCIYEQHF